MVKRVSVINFKGGVGKTCLALHLAAGLVKFHNKRVLMVDVDHQSSLSIICLGTKWEEIDKAGKTINQIFLHFTDAEREIPLPGREIIFNMSQLNNYRSYKTLDLIPSTLKLDETELDLTSTSIGAADESEWNKRTQICKWLDKNDIDKDYDYIIFDCPPATKIITQNALAASHSYVIPVVPEHLSALGIPHLVRLLKDKIEKRLNEWRDSLISKGKPIVKTFSEKRKLAGININRLESAGAARSGITNEHETALDELKKEWKDHIIEPFIGRGTGISTALKNGVPVYERPWDTNISSRGFAKKFEDLTLNLKNKIDAL